jgi:hypothetical protein
MALSSGSIDIRITPGLGRWQAVLLAAVLVACLMIGFVMGRMTAPVAATARPAEGAGLVWGHLVDHGPQAHIAQMHRDRPVTPYRAR